MRNRLVREIVLILSFFALTEPVMKRPQDNPEGYWVNYYNNHRYHEAMDNVTPSDKYFGRDREILEQRKKIKAESMKQRRKWNQKIALTEGIN